MIDYLEEILREEEVLELPAVEGGQPPKQEEESLEAAEPKSAAEGTALQTALRQAHLSGETPAVATVLQEELQAAKLSYLDIHLAQSAPVQQVRSLYDSLHHATRATQFLGETEAPERVLRVSEATSDGWDIAAVDRAVERDARRYDSGFSLY